MLFPGGTIPEGDCAVTIKYTSDNQSYLESSKNLIVDGKVMLLKNYRLKGQPIPNRIQINLLEEANQ